MDELLKEAERQSPEVGREEQPQHKRGRKGEGQEGLKSVNLTWPWELDARLDHYVAELKGKKRCFVSRKEVIIKAVDKFLKKEGY